MKVAIVGAGNGGSFTALHWGWYTRTEKDIEVELIYNPENQPERVGQATLLDAPNMLWAATGFDWYKNDIHATFKSGILYEGWGKYNDKLFHNFPADRMAMHYCPWEMQRSILNSGHFKVTESNVLDVNAVDADYVFDCRGKPTDFTDYEELKNPINAAILGKPNWNTTEAFWSRHVATPDGWTFVIPTHESSPSHDYCVGYCYNDTITSKEDAEKNFLSMFDVEVKKHVSFKNYVAKRPVIDGRIFLNGNRLFFLEPLESSSTQTYLEWSRGIFDTILLGNGSMREREWDIRRYIKQTENFVLWHYQFGSKYDTPFWDYAKTLTFQDPFFQEYLDHAKSCDNYEIVPSSYGGDTVATLYSQWPAYSFKVWYDGMTKTL